MSSIEIPTLQQAAVIENPGSNAKIVVRDDVPVQDPGRLEVLVKLTHTGICASELRAFFGWGNYDRIVGHEGVGIVVRIGEGVSDSFLGSRVGVKWLYSSCNECSSCIAGYPNNCPKQSNTGRSCPGTLQQYVVADSRYVSTIPDGLASEVAAPLLCAGLTMIGAVEKLDPCMKPGDWVVISGSGGGLGHIGVQIASRMRGWRVIAVDAGQAKRQISLTSGAEVFIDYKDQDVAEEVLRLTVEGAHGVIVVPGTEEAFRLAPQLARSRATIACVGLPQETLDIPISVMTCVRKALTIVGVMVASEPSMSELLQQARDGVIRPSIETTSLSAVPEIIDKMSRREISGRIVVSLP